MALTVLMPFGTTYAADKPTQECVSADACFWSGQTSSANICASGNIPTSVSLPQDVVKSINDNQSVYIEGAKQTNVPWQIIAAIHFRETGLKPYNPPNGQGIYQNTIGGFTPSSSVSREEFLRQTVILGQALQNDYVKRNLPGHQNPLTLDNNDPEEIKDTLYSYNGRAGIYKQQAQRLGFNPDTQPYEGSPYVMNNVDDAHKNMTMDVSDSGVKLQVDTKMGTFAIYAALLGISGGGCGASGNKIVDTAAKELGVTEAGNGNFKYTDGNNEAWCADFVSWVYKEAGSPVTGGQSGGWRIAGAVMLADWFRQNGLWTQRTDNSFTPQPGDVVLFYFGRTGDHIGIIEKTDGNTLHTIEGNTSNGVDRRQYPNYLNNSEIIGWGRKK